MATRLRSRHLFDLGFISDPQLSPDGGRAAAVVTRIEPGGDDTPPRYRSTLSLFDVAGGEALPFTAGRFADSHPRFSPDGSRLAFLARDREESKPQLYLISLSGGEAQRRTELEAGVSTFAWHPKGDRIAYVARERREESGEKARTRTIDRLPYKLDGVGFRPTEPARIDLLDLSRDRSRTLTALDFDPANLTFTPDGKRLLFTAAPDEADLRAWRQQLWSVSLKRKTLVALLEEARPIAGGLAVAPDAETLVFLGAADPDNSGGPIGLWRLPLGGGAPELISGDLDAAPSAVGDSRYGAYANTPVGFGRGGRLLVNLNHAGSSGLALISPDGEVTRLHDDGRVVSAFASDGDRAVFIAETPARPGELYVRHPDGDEARLSHLNDEFVARHALVAASDTLSFESGDGQTLSYWRLDPAKPRRGDPLVVQVHGGPHTNYGFGFSFEFQLMAAAGYTVVYGNPRGGSSFGGDFATAVQGGYGTVDADDVLAIARHARAHHRNRKAPLHLTGGSYGGFMTNWLVGHTDLFRSAVTQRSICNWLSFYGTSDIGPTFTEREIGGAPWLDLDTLWRQSPLRYVEAITTPLLILHAEEDHRCPIEQAEQLFAALKVLGRAPTRLIRFPGEGHELSRSGRPDRRVERLDAMLAWFKEHA